MPRAANFWFIFAHHLFAVYRISAATIVAHPLLPPRNFHNCSYATRVCKRNIEMTPLCNIEVTLPRVLGSREVRRGGGVVDEQAGVRRFDVLLRVQSGRLRVSDACVLDREAKSGAPGEAGAIQPV